MEKQKYEKIVSCIADMKSGLNLIKSGYRQMQIEIKEVMNSDDSASQDVEDLFFRGDMLLDFLEDLYRSDVAENIASAKNNHRGRVVKATASTGDQSILNRRLEKQPRQKSSRRKWQHQNRLSNFVFAHHSDSETQD